MTYNYDQCFQVCLVHIRDFDFLTPSAAPLVLPYSMLCESQVVVVRYSLSERVPSALTVQ